LLYSGIINLNSLQTILYIIIDLFTTKLTMDQKAFDEAVNDTMDLLDMSYSEALKDTISQFQQLVRFIYDSLVRNVLFYYSKIVLGNGHDWNKN
jgi:hypothetical protein